MSKPKDSSPPKDLPKDLQPKLSSFESVRETFDSIAIAFILAFLFRSFQAEAFVIPTGSMALTLMGAHKEIDCPKCNTRYRVGASEEFPEDGKEPKFAIGATCPNCRFNYKFRDPIPSTFNGDRILVTKFPYEFSDPERFDVAVFKNPSMAKQNYIKRVVGLPKEEILIYRGDVYVRGPDKTDFTIARKPPAKIVSTLQTVYDNDRVLPEIIERGWPERWRQLQPSGDVVDNDKLTWQTSADKKSFRAVGKPTTETWLRYQHIVPDSRAWDVLNNQALSDDEKRFFCKPQLIADFCEYNTAVLLGIEKGARPETDFGALGIHWVTDLALECELEFTEWTDENSVAVLELVEGGKAFHCRIKPASGDVELRIDGVEGFQPKVKGAIAGKGPHRIRFANVDDHLVVWLNDKPLTFDASTNFLATNSAPVYQIGTDENGRPYRRRDGRQLQGDTKLEALQINKPTEQDLRSPVGIASLGVDITASHLHLKRDLYYIADKDRDIQTFRFPTWAMLRSDLNDYRENVLQNFGDFAPPGFNTPPDIIRAFMSDVKTAPTRWDELGAVTFQLEADQFFVLGDNSPKSLDGRLWEPKHAEHYVKRELLIGKALFVYWPHGLETIPGTDLGLFKIPYFGKQYGPNFGAMRLIR